MKFTNEHIRRQDRLLNETDALSLLKNGEYGVLSMAANNTPYGIPLSYVWNGDDAIYIHCAPEGKKLELFRQNPVVSFCVVGRTHIISAKFTTEYESIVMQGNVVLDLSDAEKMIALELILDKYSPNDKIIGLKYAEKSFHRTAVFKIVTNSISGKCKIIR